MSFRPALLIVIFAATVTSAAIAQQTPPAPIRTIELPPSNVSPSPSPTDPIAPDKTETAGPPSTLEASSAQGSDAAAIGQRYLDRARGDPAKAQVWSLCAAAALRRGSASGPVADGYARETAATLRTIAEDMERSPCEDAIPQTLWGAAPASVTELAPEPTQAAAATQVTAESEGMQLGLTPTPAAGALSAAEEARLAALNRNADARAQELAERKAGTERQSRERDAAYRAAQARYESDRAAYLASVERTRAAEAEYRRQIELRRR